MTLAEALLERKATATKISELSDRFGSAAVHAEGEKPEDSVREVMNGLGEAFRHFEILTTLINRTNMEVMVEAPTGRITMMAAIVRRDCLKSQLAHYRNMLNVLKSRNDRDRYFSQADSPKNVIAEGGPTVKDMLERIDSLAQELRQLDVAIQTANWSNQV